MAEAYIFNGIMLPPVNSLTANGGWEPSPYLTITRYNNSSDKYPYCITVSQTKPTLSRKPDGRLWLSDGDDIRTSGGLAYTEDFPAFVWYPNDIGSGGTIWTEGDNATLIWTNYNLYLDGELYMKATEPIKAAYNANVMSDSMRRFVTQHIYSSIGEPEAGALISRYKQKPKTAFAVYSADDTSLTFYNNAAYEDIKAAVDAGKTVSYKGKTVTGLYTGFDGDVLYASSTDTPWKDVELSVTRIKFADIIKPLYTKMWFANFQYLTSADLRNLDTSEVTNMHSMFNACSRLEGLDLSTFDTRNVTDMTRMFQNCKALTSLDISSFDTSKVTCFYAMFYGCAAFTSLDLSHFDTRNVTDMMGMFYQCTGLTSVNLSSFDTSNATVISRLFQGCTALASVDLSSFDTSKATDMSYMFYGCTALTTVHVSDLWSTAAVTSSGSMFTNCSKLKGGNGTTYSSSYVDKTYARVDASGSKGYFTYKPSAFAVYSATDNSLTFYNNASGDYSSLKTGGTYKGKVVTDIYTGFDAATYTSATLVPWYSTRATSIKSVSFAGRVRPRSTMRWFVGCTNVTSIDLANLDTRNATTMNRMFMLCGKLTSLDVSNFDTGKVTNMDLMFDECESLVSLDLSNFDTSNVTGMYNMFYRCLALTSLNLSSFDTSKVTTMYQMFRYCKSLTYLDLSSFDTSGVTDMGWMLESCAALTTIYVADLWSTAAVTLSTKMFDACTNLKGGNGTAFNSSYVDKTYARIDTASTPGYLTRKT